MRFPDADGLLLALVGAVLVGGLTLTRLHPPPPGGEDLCWIKRQAEGHQVLSRDIPNIETCASRLEGVFLVTGEPVDGAYGGTRLRVDTQGMWAHLVGSEDHLNLIVSPGAREHIDTILRSGANADVGVP